MTKHEFQSALRERLSGLPAEDVAATVAYYREMIEDRMEDGLTEEEAVAALGPLEDVLASVLSDLPPARSEQEAPPPCITTVTYAVDQPFDSLSSTEVLTTCGSCRPTTGPAASITRDATVRVSPSRSSAAC